MFYFNYKVLNDCVNVQIKLNAREFKMKIWTFQINKTTEVLNDKYWMLLAGVGIHWRIYSISLQEILNEVNQGYLEYIQLMIFLLNLNIKINYIKTPYFHICIQSAPDSAIFLVHTEMFTNRFLGYMQFWM